jgi:hypothetical protein
LSTAQAIAAFTIQSNRYREQMDFMVREYNEQRANEQTMRDRVLTTAGSAASSLFHFLDSQTRDSRGRRPKSVKEVVKALFNVIRKKWNKVNPFNDNLEEVEDDEEDEGDVDLDKVEELAQLQYMKDNPDEFPEDQQEDQGSDFITDGGGGGDQVIPFEE